MSKEKRIMEEMEEIRMIEKEENEKIRGNVQIGMNKKDYDIM